MKITEIRAIPLRGNRHEGWEGFIDQNIHTLLQVVTDEGIWGIGSVYTNLKLVEGALQVLRGFVIGEDPTQPARITEKLHENSFWQGPGAITHTISGIDTAMYDIAGKAAKIPVWKLLGGRYRESARPYGSILFEAPGPLREHILDVREKGFRSIKIGWGPFGRRGYAYDEMLVKTAREAAGADIELMVDAGGSDAFWPNGLTWAIRTADMLKSYDIVWFEEPLRPVLIDDYVRLRERSPVPIAWGETIAGRFNYMPLIEKGAADILQPDNTKCGGLSESLKMAWYAHDHGIKVICHGWNTAVGLMADLHFAAALPLTDRVEFMTPSEYIEDIVSEPFKMDEEGNLRITDAPGLGLALDPDGIERLSGMKFEGC